MKKLKQNKSDSTTIDKGKDRRPYTKLGLYKEIDVSQVDGRTRLGKTISGLKRELRGFVGNPTPVTELLIHRIIYKTVKLTLYEASNLQNLKVEEADHYLPMSNSLRLDLTALVQIATQNPQRGPDLDRYISERYGKREK